MAEARGAPADRLQVHHMFAYRFALTKLPEGISSASDEPDEEDKVAVLVTNDNVQQLWPLIDAARQEELVDGRYVSGPGLTRKLAKMVPTTRPGDPAGTDPEDVLLNRTRTAPHGRKS
jgi:hypothetical protein